MRGWWEGVFLFESSEGFHFLAFLIVEGRSYGLQEKLERGLRSGMFGFFLSHELRLAEQ